MTTTGLPPSLRQAAPGDSPDRDERLASRLIQLEAAVAADPRDWVAKVSLANALEQAGRLGAARTLYEEVSAADPAGMVGASARKALQGLGAKASPPESTSAPAAIPSRGAMRSAAPSARRAPSQAASAAGPVDQKSPLQWFYNLPIRRKQLAGLFTSEVISIVGLVGVGAVLIITGGRTQLLRQAESELTVSNINYNIKIDQMGFGFRGQSDNSAVIGAALAYQDEGEISPEQRGQVEQVLRNEITARTIEYATLVGADRRIIASANADRTGEVFDPNGLVTQVLAEPTQIKASAIVPWSELARESPPLPPGVEGRDALVRYTATPVFAPGSSNVIGALISGDVVDGKLPIVANTVNAFEGGYSAIYSRLPSGDFQLASAYLRRGDETMVMAASTTETSSPEASSTGEGEDSPPADRLALSDLELLAAAAAEPTGQPVTGRLAIDGQSYTLAARALPDPEGEPVAFLVRGTPETNLNLLLRNSLLLQGGVSGIALLADIILAIVLGRAIVDPVRKLQRTTQQFAAGDRQARATIYATDEVGELAGTFNQMAASITTTAAALETQTAQQQAAADFQRQEKERLQQQVITLLLEIEGAQFGDLTVQAQVGAGEMGSVADAFNATVRSLREIVTQVKATADQVHESAYRNETSVQQLFQAATHQADSMTQALTAIEAMNESLQAVGTSALETAAIAKTSLAAAEAGQLKMDATVTSIEDIRSSVATTAKRVKRLAESSQEISKVVSIISSISEKTNLLAFNASIEAARAGEHGQGFRIVADEVRRLAERVTESTKDIEQLVGGIQQETADVLATMESSTTQVVLGTRLITDTKESLQQVAQTSREMDRLIQTISAQTVSQGETSVAMTQTMQEVAAIAQDTARESQQVAQSLQTLVGIAADLQAATTRFRVSGSLSEAAPPDLKSAHPTGGEGVSGDA